jgi:hypothetical protein
MKSVFAVILALFSFAIVSTTFAQDQKPTKTNETPEIYQAHDNYTAYEVYSAVDTVKYSNLYNSSMGLKFSTITGYGLSVSTRFLDYLSIGVCGVIQYSELMKWSDLAKTKVTEDQKDILYSFGVELRGNMFSTNKTNIYALIGASMGDDKTKNISEDKYTTTSTVGLGFGLQWFFSKRISGDLNVGYKFDYIEGLENGSPRLKKQTNIGFGFGLSYMF